MKGKNMKIKLRNKFGSGAVFDFDWKIIFAISPVPSMFNFRVSKK